MSSQAIQEARKAAIPNTLPNKLINGELAYSFSIKFVNNIEIVHYAAVAGYDAILIDLEHGTLSLDTTAALSITALQVGLTPSVRVAANSSEWISRVLDAGAQAVIIPHIDTAEEARNVVKYAKFAPLGERSATNNMPQFRYANVPYGPANIVSNELTTVICMIESETALKNLDSIAAVEGVDVLLIGSADLTQDMGIPGEFDSPRLAEAYAMVCAACEKASVDGRRLMCGMGGINGRPDLVERFAGTHRPARFVMAGADNGVLLSAMRTGAAKFKNIADSVKANGAQYDGTAKH